MKLKELLSKLLSSQQIQVFLNGEELFYGKCENFPYVPYMDFEVFEIFSYSEVKDYDNYYSIISINLKGE